MDLPPNIFHGSSCSALARFHVLAGLRAKASADKQFHFRRADAFVDAAFLPPAQVRLIINLSSRFPAFAAVRGSLVSGLGRPASTFAQT